MDAHAAINGIQEVSGSIPLISTKKHSISFEIECFSILFSLFCAGRFRLGQQMDNRPSQQEQFVSAPVAFLALENDLCHPTQITRAFHPVSFSCFLQQICMTYKRRFQFSAIQCQYSACVTAAELCAKAFAPRRCHKTRLKHRYQGSKQSRFPTSMWTHHHFHNRQPLHPLSSLATLDTSCF